jgi:hypothetical protein
MDADPVVPIIVPLPEVSRVAASQLAFRPDSSNFRAEVAQITTLSLYPPMTVPVQEVAIW